jgi:hypothetical protein
MMKDFDDEVKNVFIERCSLLDETAILRLNTQNSSGELNNVIVGLNKECFGVLMHQDDVSYDIFYVARMPVLRGSILQLKLTDQQRDNLVLLFSKYLVHSYPNLDEINVFNTFQQFVRSMLEMLGFFTLTSKDLDRFEDKNPVIIAKGVKGIEILSLVDKVKAFRELFGNSYKTARLDGENFIYLMINTRNQLIKIGLSIRPKFRERTLQSQEPEVLLLALWIAPKSMERKLHNQFKQKRERGEWFSLNTQDLVKIKEVMQPFELDNGLKPEM